MYVTFVNGWPAHVSMSLEVEKAWAHDNVSSSEYVEFVQYDPASGITVTGR